MRRSGLKSAGRTTTPPRGVRGKASAPPSPTTASSPKSLVGPTATALRISTSMPSRLSWKSMPSSAGSNTVPSASTSPAAASSAMTRRGGTRPPSPTTVGAIAPAPAGVTVGAAISVVVRLTPPPARNSATRPPTSTA
jgi:hypothetical protein